MMISPFLLFFYLTVCHLIFDIKEAALRFVKGPRCNRWNRFYELQCKQPVFSQ
jgi:hypothetical protein